MSPFLIFSLCRSRSSWLSVLLTTDRSICLHDYAAYSRALPELPGYDYVGMADTGAALEFKHWRRSYPSAPLVVVRRDPRQAAASLARVVRVPYRKLLARAQETASALDEIEGDRHALSLDFSEVDSRAEEIFQHCLPGLYFDRERLRLLSTMNIQPHPAWMRAEIERLQKEGWPRA